MGGYSVDPGELLGADAGLGGASAQARAALAPLRACAGELLAGRWQGGAAAAFRLGWQQWLDGVDAMLAALDETAALLGASGRDYAAADNRVRTSMAATGPAG